MYRLRWRRCETTPFQSPPAARMGHVAVTVDASETWGGTLLVVHGGLGDDKRTLGDVAVLQSADGGWFHPGSSGHAPPCRVFHAAAALGRQVYIFGGHMYLKDRKVLQRYNDVWRLDTDTWQWEAVEYAPGSPAPCARDFATMVDLPGGRLLMFGGLDAAERRMDDTWVMDVYTRTWSEVKVSGGRPRARYGHCLLRLGQRVLLFGGESSNGMSSDLWALRGVTAAEGDDAAPAWSPLELPGNPPPPRKGHAMAGLSNNLVAVMGGHSSEFGWFRATKTDVLMNDVAVIDRGAGAVAWRHPEMGPPGEDGGAGHGAEGEVPQAREFHTLSDMPSGRAGGGGRALLFGGGNGKVIFGDAWWLEVEFCGSPSQRLAGVPRTHSALAPGLSTPTAIDTAVAQAMTAFAPRPPSTAAPTAGAAPPLTAVQQQQQQSERGMRTADVRPGETAESSRWPQPSMAMKQVYLKFGVHPLGRVRSGSSALSSSWQQQQQAQSMARAGGVAGTATAGINLDGDGVGGCEEALAQLGERLRSSSGSGDGDGDGASAATDGSVDVTRVAAARRFLSQAPPEQLRVGEVALMMSDYRQLSRLGLALALRAGQTSPLPSPTERGGASKSGGQQQELAAGGEEAGCVREEDKAESAEQQQEQAAASPTEGAGDQGPELPGPEEAEAPPPPAPVPALDLDRLAVLLSDPALAMPGRFSHLAGAGVRVCDVPCVQGDYRALLQLHALQAQ